MIEEAKAWVRRKTGIGEILRIVCGKDDNLRAYRLYTAYEEEEVGRILFDVQGYWIYDGKDLSIDEQEQVATFIINRMSKI